MIIGEVEITDPELSNAFNRHFTEIGPNLASQINPPCVSTFELQLLTIDELHKLVNDIPVGKADGLDVMATCMLLVNKSVTSCIFRVHRAKWIVHRASL